MPGKSPFPAFQSHFELVFVQSVYQQHAFLRVPLVQNGVEKLLEIRITFVYKQQGDIALTRFRQVVCELRQRFPVLFVQNIAWIVNGNMFRRRFAFELRRKRRTAEESPGDKDVNEEQEKKRETPDSRQSELDARLGRSGFCVVLWHRRQTLGFMLNKMGE